MLEFIIFYIKNLCLSLKQRKCQSIYTGFFISSVYPFVYRLGIIETEKVIGHFWVFLGYSSMAFLSYILHFFVLFDLGSLEVFKLFEA